MTSQAAPLTIFNGLMSEAVDLLNGKPWSQFELKRLEREIEKLGNADKGGALELRAHLAAVRGDTAESMMLFERALALTSDFVGSVVRFLLVAGRLGESEKVMEVFSTHRGLIRTNPDALRTVASVLGYSGWIVSADELDVDLVRMGLEPRDGTGKNPQALDNRGFSEANIAEAVGFVHKFLRSRGAFPVGTRHFAASLEHNSDSLFFGVGVDLEPAKIAELEMELFAALAEQAFRVEDERFLVFGLMTGWNQQNADQLH